MTRVPYLQWEHVLLDTSIIFMYLQALRESNTDQRPVFVKRLIDDLVANENSKKRKRKFYISAISVSEMLDKSASHGDKMNRIIAQMNVSNLTYLPFDLDVASFMTSEYHSVLGTEKLSNFSKEIGINNAIYDMNIVREWLTKDLMIIATAQHMKCDVAITMDKRTFIPAANKVGYFSCHAIPENFNHNDKYIFEYYANGFSPITDIVAADLKDLL